MRYRIHDEPPVVTGNLEAVRAARELGYEVLRSGKTRARGGGSVGETQRPDHLRRLADEIAFRRTLAGLKLLRAGSTVAADSDECAISSDKRLISGVQKQSATWLTPEQVERIRDACLTDAFSNYLSANRIATSRRTCSLLKLP